MYPANDIFSLENHADFLEKALEIFNYQYNYNPTYREFVDLRDKKPSNIETLEDIPFLPIEFFKSRKILTGPDQEKMIFTSSGTTDMEVSKHYVTDPGLYEQSFTRGFEHFFGSIKQYNVLALLPAYLERTGSSLVYMVDKLIKISNRKNSGFYMHNHEDLSKKIIELERDGEKTLLLGVSFALLDFTEKYNFQLKNTLVMETGGMKGRKKEITREELHEILEYRFGVDKIYSEYGMTELLSQAYCLGEGKFQSPPWMKILTRDPYDPYNFIPAGRTGGINIIDLANIHSCAFIQTSDLGRVNKDGTFDVLGRFDQSDTRGCNLMVQG
ncbi:MAG: acyl transferase [bacterium]